MVRQYTSLIQFQKDDEIQILSLCNGWHNINSGVHSQGALEIIGTFSGAVRERPLFLGLEFLNDADTAGKIISYMCHSTIPMAVAGLV